jgi:hypothetical protein
MDNMNTGREFGWDDTIEKDSDFVLLPEGDYDFTVVGFERGRHSGSDKLPPCNKATVTLKIVTPQGETLVKHNLFLHSITEGMLCSFFTAIGQRKHGERVTMNWNAVVGAKGRCKLGVRKYNDNEYNEVKKFYEPDGSAPATPAGFEPGRF